MDDRRLRRELLLAEREAARSRRSRRRLVLRLPASLPVPRRAQRPSR